jgi:ricin-type beta-trefoil lectin protein
MRRVHGLPLRLMAVLAVVATALLTSAGPADATSLDTQHRQLRSGWNAATQCLYEVATTPNQVKLSSVSSCPNYNEWKGNNDWTIRNVATGYCLTTSAASGTSVPVTASLCSGSAYQEWSESQYPGKPTGEMRYHNLGNNWYLDVNPDGTIVTKILDGTSNTQGWWDCIDGMGCPS